jgi:hypothetical protein
MHIRYSLLAVGTLLLAGFAFGITGVRAQTPCTGSSHIATQAEITASNGQIPAGSPVCDNATGGISISAGEAKEYLYSISTKVNTADKAHIDGLNNTFAVCAAQFLKAFQKNQTQYAPLTITSAWRSDADQARVSTSPTSNHTRGLAIDVHPKGQTQPGYDALMNFAIANKQFGVCFARPSYNGAPDRPHMTAAGIGSNTENCAKYGITKMCDAGGKFDPNAAASPTQTNQGTPLNSIFSQQQQQPYSSLLANQTLPASQQPYTTSGTSGGTSGSSGGTTGSSGGTSSGTTGTSVSTGSGTTGTSVTTGTSGSGTTNTAGTTNTGSNTLAQLNTIAGDAPAATTSSTSTASSTPIALNDNLTNANTNLSKDVPADENGTTTWQGSSVALRPTTSDIQTFVSNDMSGNTVTATSSNNTSFIAGVLQKFKLILISIIEKLKPFVTPMGVTPTLTDEGE